MFAVCHSSVPLGVSARAVEVEVDVRRGKAAVTFVGLPDVAVKEARDRVKTAILNSGYAFPHESHVTVNLAPADLRKEGTHFDLPVALALLRATGQIRAPLLRDHIVIGELALDGRVRPVRGILCVAHRASRGGRWKGIVVPAENAAEAALAETLPVVPVRTLGEAAAFVDGAGAPAPAPSPAPAAAADRAPFAPPDFAEVRGQPSATRAALLAAAGGHHLLLVGPPGSGKTMIAERLPWILPPLERDDAIEATKIHSVAGLLRGGLVSRPPYRAPHHTVSSAALMGGGPRATAGEITLAHRGVLFLDELPEFDRRSLEALREPVERGEIHVSRVSYRVRYPCRVLLVAAMNPCPCGNHGVADRECRCSPREVERYRARISGPLLDRFDLQVRVPPVAPGALGAGAEPGPSSAELARAVARARKAQAPRGRLNAALPLDDLDRFGPPDRDARAFLEEAVRRLRLSARAHVRVRRLARTVADLASCDRVLREHIAEAVGYRLRE